MGGQLPTYPQAQEEFLLAARHHATILQHRTDLLQGFGSEQCGLVAEDTDVSVLWHGSQKTLLGQAGRGEGQGSSALRIRLPCTRLSDQPITK